jgi:hypothetical protein
MLETLRFPKNDKHMYLGRNGWGYLCGLAACLSANDQVISINPINSIDRSGRCQIDIPLERLDDVVAMLYRAAKKEKKPSSVELLMAEEPWGQHSVYDREQWMLEIAMKNTQRGYWDWVQARVEVDEKVED